MFRNTGTSDVELRVKAQQLGELIWTNEIPGVDPEKIDKSLTIDEKIVLVKQIIDMIDTFKTYQKYYKDEMIPPQVIEEFNKKMEETGQDYYIKRSLTMDLDTSYTSLMNFIYGIEYGPRVQTINALNITNKENELVNVTMDVESHTLKNVIEKTDEENSATETGTTGGVSMR